MTSKGPVDFFLGVFLEFGAAFCLLFFLPHVPWHWVPGKTPIESSSAATPSRLGGISATERRITLFSPQSKFAPPALALPTTSRLKAPALLPAETEPTFVPAVSAPLASHQPTASPRSHYRRELPRQYRY